MAAQVVQKRQSAARSATLTNVMVRLILLLAIDAFVFYFVFRAIGQGFFTLSIMMVVVAAFANYVILARDMYPIRWMLAGLILMFMFAIYPILLTVFVAFTNYGDGHLLTKQQSIELITQERYLPEGGSAYAWTGFKNEAGDYALWLQNETGSFLAYPGEPLIPAAEAEVGALDDKGIPEAIGDYARLNAIRVASDQTIPEIQFGSVDDGVQIRSAREAAQLQKRYVYDAERDVLVDQETSQVYTPVVGRWTNESGDELTTGFRANIGFDNFTRFFTSSAFRGPLVRIIIWNFVFAFLSVFMTFALGLGIAYIFNDPEFPGKKFIRSVLLIPYTIPSLITILIWKGMFNNQVGVINRFLTRFVNSVPTGLQERSEEIVNGILINVANFYNGVVINIANFFPAEWQVQSELQVQYIPIEWWDALASPSWTTDQWLAKIALLIVNLWLGYPYFMLICSGALQSIPQDLYAAAEVDGANGWQRFFRITLPLLLVSVGPLLVASFTYNFNNFNLIFLFIEGGPPIPNSPTRAGHTDILISYVYNLAFASGRGKEYGLGAAITIVIFVIVAVITLAQFRYTKMWEEVGEGV